MTDALIVPINVQAACVTKVDRESSVDWAPSTTQFQELPVDPGAYLSENCIYTPFDGEAPPQVGIHLHWALPTALTRAIFDASSNQHVFPDVPNRWLVVRTATAVDEKGTVISAPTSQSWVVESDYVNKESPPSEGATNVQSLAIPVIYPFKGDIKDPKPNIYCYIGGVYEGTKWTEGGDPQASHVPHLNALGCNGTIGTSPIQISFGMPEFAIYYPNCCNVFGLHDDLSDLQRDSGLFNVSYSVIGWYSPDANDPLKDPKFCQKVAWTLPDGSFPTSLYSVYSGMVQSIAWNPNASASVDFPDSLPAVLAPNSKEALASYLQSVDPQTPHVDGVNIEQLLNVFQLGLFNEYSNTDLPLDVMEIWHQSRFSTQDGGTSWVLQNSDSSKVMKDPNILNQLNQMNALQKKSDKVGSLLEEQRFQIFADWYKYLLSEYAQQNDSQDIPNSGIIHAFLKNQISELILPNQKLIAELATQISLLNSQIMSAAIKLDPNWKLQSIKAPRYWGVRDPSVLIGGITPSSRYSSESNLTCRLSSQILTKLTVQKEITGTVDIECLSTDFDFSNNLPKTYKLLGLIDVVLSLARETALLGSNQLIWDILKQKKASVATDFNTKLRNVLSSFPKVNFGLAWTGDLPSSIAFEVGQAPWSPIRLQWIIDYLPNCSVSDAQSDAYPPDFVSKIVSFDANGIDYVYNSTFPLKEKDPQEFTGSIFITPLAHLTLKQQLSHFFTQSSTAPQKLQAEHIQLEKLKDYLTENYPVISQTLHGLTNLFSMRIQTIQLPVADPFESINPPTFSSQIQSAVGANNSLAPLITKPGYFNPIISGTFTLKEIRLIDVFGRFKDFSTSLKEGYGKLSVTTSTSYHLSGTPDVAHLVPRLTQPCRLNCNFLSAADGNILITTPVNFSPICGWIVPDVLENNILLYANDTEAAFLGTLVPEGNKFHLQPPFVMPSPTIKNPYFKHLIEGLTSVTPAQDFIEAISQALNTILPNFSHDPNFSTLLGWPLALVRVSLQMESLGSPVFQQSWPSLKSDAGDSGQFQTYSVDNIVFADRGNHKYPQVSFPTRVGNFVNLNDGVVGYFIESSNQPYQTFYPTTNKIDLDTDPKSSAITLSLIVDPRAAIHVAPGMLPVQSLEIPPDFFTKILTRFAIDFLVAPILSPASKALLPVPGGEPANQWSFYYGNPKSGSTILPTEEVQSKGPFTVKNIQIAEGWLTSTVPPE